MKTKRSYKTDDVKFSVNQQGIDYFEIPEHVLRLNGYKVIKNLLPLKANEWLDVNTHLANIDHSKSESVVLNIQVGKGKSHGCYQLIKKYASEGYVVLVLSPFQKLVDKDYKELKGLSLDVFNFNNIEETFALSREPGYHFNFSPEIDHDVHVMTIHCLLQNPGTKAYDQVKHKQEFLRKILWYCRNRDRKVIMFFDEIHESIENFKAEYLPNLIRWKGIVHKTFISSATYTPAAIQAVQYIAALTKGNISIYETPRLKIDQPVSLHLHILERSYSGNDLSSLSHLKTVIDDANRKNKRVNILIGHKSVAKALINLKKNPDDEELIKTVKSLNPNLITGEENNEFMENRTNIGTAFKTGVDIKDSNSVFICLMPCIYPNSDGYGIFSDGIPSLIQSLARVRRIGDVHVFMMKPNTIINKAAGMHLLPVELTDNTEDEQYQNQNSHLSTLVQTYSRIKRRTEREANEIHRIQEKKKLKLGWRYPSFNDYLVNSSQEKLVANHYSYGKEISSYILWAAINDQFCNATLKEVTYTYTPKKVVGLVKGASLKTWAGLLTDDMAVEASNKNLPDAVDSMLMAMTSAVEQDAIPVQFTIGGRNVTISGVKAHPSLVQSLIDAYICKLTSGKLTALTKEDYILTCTVKAATMPAKEITSGRMQLYNELDRLRQDFLAEIHHSCIQNGKKETIIDRGAWQQLKDTFVAEAIEKLKAIAEDDSLFKGRIYSLLLKIDEVTDLKDRKIAVYGELERCFTNVTNSKRSFNGKKDQFYLVDGTLEKLPSGLLTPLPLL